MLSRSGRCPVPVTAGADISLQRAAGYGTTCQRSGAGARFLILCGMRVLPAGPRCRDELSNQIIADPVVLNAVFCCHRFRAGLCKIENEHGTPKDELVTVFQCVKEAACCFRGVSVHSSVADRPVEIGHEQAGEPVGFGERVGPVNREPLRVEVMAEDFLALRDWGGTLALPLTEFSPAGTSLARFHPDKAAHDRPCRGIQVEQGKVGTPGTGLIFKVGCRPLECVLPFEVGVAGMTAWFSKTP